MKSHVDCALGGIRLSGVDDRICVLDVTEHAPVTDIALSPVWGEGIRLLQNTRQKLEVTVRFAVLEEDPIRRSEVLQSVFTWAQKGGLLTVDHRPGQRLRVICTGWPGVSADDWTAELTMTFSTVHTPWWEDANAVQATGGDIMTLAVPGTAPNAPVDAVVINTGSATITHLTLHCDLTEMTFRNIVLPPGSIFSLMHREGAAVAWVDGESVLSCRTPVSDDQLLLPCGQTSTVYVSAETPLQATFSVRGRYA